MGKRAVILDFDGVIMDTESAVIAAWRAECAETGLIFDEAAFAAAVGVPSLTPQRVAALLGAGTVDPLAFATNVRRRLRAASAELPVLPGVRELLAEASAARVPVAVASGASRDWVLGHLNRAGVLPGLAAVVCREDARAGKPAPDLYLVALSRLHVDARQAVAVEDSLTGVTAAQAAGVRCIAVPGPTTIGHDLSAADQQLTTLAGVSLADLFADRP
ncbi:HAD-IA family hydrolase [Kineosporia rhizophila]|uniref:HAD family hydrolase n=1 Tax=Kineosporia TaxID=49184 RepID=UPI001E4D6E69|nr:MULTISPECIES: HAD-IA family hydrolase [Kineosporia]MCE0539750.1 HAD-IA family hydrolase [Kineosporia rhizophila]GLY16354.1 haloacid dehalogenase [Kineosporia sp. NBRC 101677]